MKKKRTDSKVKIYTNRLFRRVICIYMMVLLLVGGFACHVTYINAQNELLDSMDDVMMELNQRYKNSTQNFWRLYMPVFSDDKEAYTVLRNYFQASKNELSPLKKKELLDMLQEIVSLDGRIKWIGLYSGRDAKNYLYFENEGGVEEMPAEFPFIDDMEQKGTMMEVYGSQMVSHRGKDILSFALCGGTGFDMNGGKIIVGYATSEIAAGYSEIAHLNSARYYLINEFGLVYDSTGNYEYPEEVLKLGADKDSGIVINQDKRLMYVRKSNKTENSYNVYCVLPWKDLFIKSNTNTWQIIGVLFVLLVGSVEIYLWTRKNVLHKIEKIELGLEKIGNNELGYRIPIDIEQSDEFDMISQSINDVAERLQENINRTYELKLKQKEAVLAELQAKFDPHFLYNTLEVIRSKVYENGDIETSDVIIKLAQIFRSFIGSERFVTIRDEMDFCNMYLSLLQYRYEDMITIIYDIDSDILQYGIIRNLLQPILENFFVHGFDAHKQHNMLNIRGKVYDQEYIRFMIQDDGLGISKEKLLELQAGLNDAVQNAQSSYGLKNVHRRIHLFYGQDCGLAIRNNQLGGVTVEVKIRKLTYEEHEVRMYESV